jgi:hypothetical protein
MDIPELPPCRIVVVADVASSSARSSAEMPKLSDDVVRLLREAVERAGLAGEEWCFPQSSGDGYAFGLRAAVAPRVLDAFPGALQQVLAEEAERLPRHAIPPRMRVPLQLGHVPDRGSSAPLVQAHRLVDSAPVRDALAQSDADMTYVAVILSKRIFTDVVAASYSALRPGELTRVPVRVKEFEEEAYVHLPRPSGRWLGAVAVAGAASEAAAAPYGSGGGNGSATRATPAIEIAAAAQLYAPPPAAPLALRSLLERRVVVLAGDPGERRSTALWLLGELARSDGISVVDVVKRWARPSASFLPLAAHEGAVLDLNDPATDTAEPAFAEDVRTYATALAERGSYLVITVRSDLWRDAWQTLPAVELGRRGDPVPPAPTMPKVQLERVPWPAPDAVGTRLALPSAGPGGECLWLTSPDGQETVYPLRNDLGSPRPVVTLGRAALGAAPPDIVLDDASSGSWISRDHCRLEHDRGRWYLVPRGSNRPLLRGSGAESDAEAEPVTARTRLRDGDVVLIRNTPTPDGRPRRWSIQFADPQDTRATTGHEASPGELR